MSYSYPLWMYIAVIWSVYYWYNVYCSKPLFRNRKWMSMEELVAYNNARAGKPVKLRILTDSPERLFLYVWNKSSRRGLDIRDMAKLYAEWKNRYGHPGMLPHYFRRDSHLFYMQQLISVHIFQKMAAETLSLINGNQQAEKHDPDAQKALYRKLARLCHPDKVSGPEAEELFKALNNANEKDNYTAMLLLEPKILKLKIVARA